MRRSILGIAGLWLLLAAPVSAQVTPATALGTTINDPGSPRRSIYKMSVSYTAFTCAAVTCDLTLGTIPAKTRLMGIVVDLTQAFVCAGTCTTSTLSMTVGKTAGGAEWVASFDIDAAAATKGLADADMGTTMTRAAAINGGDMLSWTAATTAQVRVTSGTGNIGNATVTNFNAGAFTVWLITEQFQ